MPENQRFFVGLKAFIRNGDRILILQESERYKSDGSWDLPGGRIKGNEINVPLRNILAREISEECGADFKVKVFNIINGWKRPDHPDGPEFLFGFDCVYEGGNIQLSEEHDNHAWVSRKELNNYKFVKGFKDVIDNYLQKIK